MKTRVINHMHRGLHPPDEQVYVGRPSKWGNPFKEGRDGDRHQCIQQYREYIFRQPELLADLPELRGRILVCWCHPLPCHADVLAELCNTSTT